MKKKELRAEIKRLREERDLYQMSSEEGSEINGELTAALARIYREKLTPCSPPCVGHFGPKTAAAFSAALKWSDRVWEALEAIRDYEPSEIVYDEFAYKRMVESFRSAARKALETPPEVMGPPF